MPTETLKEADRYLANCGFTCTSVTHLHNMFQARYDFGSVVAKPPRGIRITLNDSGNGRWTYFVVAYSQELRERVDAIEQSLKQLPGFEPLR